MKTIRDFLEAEKEKLKKHILSKSVRRCKTAWLIRGDIPLCLVAHIDTVHDINRFVEFRTGYELLHERKKEIFYDSKKKVFWSPDGLGADDRAGVYALFKIHEETEKKPYLLFTDHEECGGLGAYAATQHFKINLRDMKIFIEIDRRGANDCVFYNHEPDEFKRNIEKFGFKEAVGSFSDISIIGRELCRPCVNLSCGYYNEHSFREYLRVQELEKTISKVKRMIRKAAQDESLF